MDQIVAARNGPALELTLARPEVRNSLSLETMIEVTKSLRQVPDDVKAVVIGARGPAFSAGHDLGEMVEQPGEFYVELFELCTDMMKAIHGLPQPVIAKVQGVATAAGCQLVAACDLAVAADTAWFATPGVKIGLFCTTPAVPLVRVIGRRRAMEMLLTARPVAADTALAWGLVNEVVPEEELDLAVARYVETIASYSSRVVGSGKVTFYRQAEANTDDAYRIATEAMAEGAAQPEAQEGIRAFLEKRPPEWPD